MHDRLIPGRTITGMSAVLLPFDGAGSIDWRAFEAHVARTAAAGLTPAVNMDTGYVQLLDEPTRDKVLDVTAATVGSDFVAGAFVADEAGESFDVGGYLDAAGRVQAHGATPMIFPSHGLNQGSDDEWLGRFAQIGGELDRFFAFELGTMFVPYGKIVSLDTYRGLLEIASCAGAKHSSLHRKPEWDRLAVRDELRPDFLVLTGNDLAIDMVMYGSDYLLGLSTFAPDLFGLHDRMWATGDEAFYELNDLLQYLGFYTFRDPVPAYRHSAAMVFELRGWATSDEVPAGAPRRDPSDRAVLADLVERLEAFL